jgi:hypothetical protein
MNDITKARAFLTAQKSDLQHLTSFGLMLATATQEYRDLQLNKKGKPNAGSVLDKREVDAALNLAALRYLKRHNQLPPNVKTAFRNGVTAEEQRELAMTWMNA